MVRLQSQAPPAAQMCLREKAILNLSARKNVDRTPFVYNCLSLSHGARYINMSVQSQLGVVAKEKTSFGKRANRVLSLVFDCCIFRSIV